MEAKLIKKNDIFYLYVDESWSIASTDVKDNRDKKLSLKNCQEIENGYDLDELAKQENGMSQSECSTIDEQFKFYEGYKSGFQKALEILGDKKYSELDLYRAFTTNSAGNEDTIRDRFYNVLLPSLQQIEWDIEIVMDNNPFKYLVTIGEVTTSKFEPKLDADGCLILKRK